MKWIGGAAALWATVAMLSIASVAPLSAQFSNKPTRPKVVPPKGEARKVIFKDCTSCHGIDDYAYNSLDRAGWNALLESKHQDRKSTRLNSSHTMQSRMPSSA